MARRNRKCAYCGKTATTVDHVVPKCLFPPIPSGSPYQVVTVPACEDCNGEFQKDEAYFRTVLSLSGEPNDAARERWETKISPSFDRGDGQKIIKDLFNICKPHPPVNSDELRIYPAKEPRVRHILRKIIRGFCHEFELATKVDDARVCVDVYRIEIPSHYLTGKQYHYGFPGIFRCIAFFHNSPELHSFWLMEFYGNKPFVGTVSNTKREFPIW